MSSKYKRGQMIRFGVDRNYEPSTGKRGTEAAYCILGRYYLSVRWRSAEDGRTPMLAIGWQDNKNCLRGRTFYFLRPAA